MSEQPLTLTLKRFRRRASAPHSQVFPLLSPQNLVADTRDSPTLTNALRNAIFLAATGKGNQAHTRSEPASTSPTAFQDQTSKLGDLAPICSLSICRLQR